MYEIRFLKDKTRVGELEAATLPAARDIAAHGLDHADRAIIVRSKNDNTNEYVEVRPLPLFAKPSAAKPST
jgi:hypothetical protein